jgi:Asp-tRNA(Asn)/Glu-tRNA(Gln) amidotransferase A subunit family amidase
LPGPAGQPVGVTLSAGAGREALLFAVGEALAATS